MIVFIDESGLSERPTRVRTWAPKGQTPVIQFHFNWKQLSMIAGVSFTNAYFRLHEGAIRSTQIVEFLKALVKQIGRPLLIIWDGLKAHRSRLVRDYVDGLDGKIELAFLPPYAPDLNPVEYLWAWPKRHALANYCPNSINEPATTTAPGDLLLHCERHLDGRRRHRLQQQCADRLVDGPTAHRLTQPAGTGDVTRMGVRDRYVPLLARHLALNRFELRIAAAA